MKKKFLVTVTAIFFLSLSALSQASEWVNNERNWNLIYSYIRAISPFVLRDKFQFRSIDNEQGSLKPFIELMEQFGGFSSQAFENLTSEQAFRIKQLLAQILKNATKITLEPEALSISYGTLDAKSFTYADPVFFIFSEDNRFFLRYDPSLKLAVFRNDLNPEEPEIFNLLMKIQAEANQFFSQMFNNALRNTFPSNPF